MAYRTHNCNELTFDNLNQRVQLAGWVDTIRDHAALHSLICVMSTA